MLSFPQSAIDSYELRGHYKSQELRALEVANLQIRDL